MNHERREWMAKVKSKLETLNSISAVTKERILDKCRAMTAAEMEYYLNKKLVIVQDYFDTVEHEHFQELCNSLRFADRDTLARHFSNQEYMSSSWWSVSAMNSMNPQLLNDSHSDPNSLSDFIYAAANHFAWPMDYDGAYADEGYDDAKVNGWHIAQAYLNILSVVLYSKRAAAFAGCLFDVEDEDFSSSRRIDTKMKRHEMHPTLLFNFYTQWIKALRINQSHTQANCLICALLGVDNNQELECLDIANATASRIESVVDFPQTDEKDVEAFCTLKLSLYAAYMQLLADLDPELSIAIFREFSRRHISSEYSDQLVCNYFKQEIEKPWAVSVYGVIAQYCHSLNLVSRLAEALPIFEGCYSITSSDYEIQILRHRFYRMIETCKYGNLDLFIAIQYASSLDCCGKQREALNVMEVIVSGNEVCADRSAMVAKLDKRRKMIHGDHGHSIFAVLWANSLKQFGFSEDSNKIIQTFFGDLSFLGDNEELHRGSVLTILPPIEVLYETKVANDSELGVRLTRKVMKLLKNTVDYSCINPLDRKQFYSRIQYMRTLITGFAFRWLAEATDPGEQQDRWVETLLWDAELGQRVLLERYLGRQPAEPAGLPETLPKLLLPQAEQKPDEKPKGCNSSQDPLGAAFADDGEDAALSAGCFDLERVDRPGAAPPRSSIAKTRSQEYERLAATLKNGIAEGDLIQWLHHKERLFRAGFDANGRLVWGVFAALEGRLLLLGSGTGTDGDEQRLTRLAEMLDLELELGWLKGGKKSKTFKTLFMSVREAIKSYRQNEALLQDVLNEIKSALVLCETHNLAANFELLHRIVDAPLTDEASAEMVRSVIEKLGFYLDWSAAPGNTDDLINRPTERFLRAAAQILPFEELLQKKILLQDDDVLLQVEGPLHRLSFPHLPINEQGHCFYQEVRSIRVILSTALNQWLNQQQQLAAKTYQKKGTIVSWVKDQTDAGWVGLKNLNEKIGALGGMDWFLASEKLGNTKVLRQVAQEQNPPDLLVVCGHGGSGQTNPQTTFSGVILADGVWTGTQVVPPKDAADLTIQSGCDLSGVDLLLQVSCSIGRVATGGAQDIEGFCVETTLAGGRSVIAAKWKIHVIESTTFAAEIAKHYHQLMSDASDSRCCRARALNDARNAVAEQGIAVGINTLAAFDLYGIG